MYLLILVVGVCALLALTSPTFINVIKEKS